MCERERDRDRVHVLGNDVICFCVVNVRVVKFLSDDWMLTMLSSVAGAAVKS